MGRKLRLVLFFSATCFSTVACSPNRSPSGDDQGPWTAEQDSAVAQAAIKKYREQYHFALPEVFYRRDIDIQNLPRRGAAIPPAASKQIERSGNRLRAHLEDTLLVKTHHPATVLLARRASDGFHLRDQNSGLSVNVAPADAAPTAGEAADGYVLYRGALEGSRDLLHRLTATGTEDYVPYDAPPARSEVSYRLALGDTVTGLRLVNNVLELLDQTGTPRLRVARPYLIGQDEQRHDANLSVEGCAVDVSPLAPWGRPVTLPGARTCTVRISWSNADIPFPALLDPSWTTTGDLIDPRQQGYALALLNNGKVLASGGGMAATELYDSGSGTWAATGTMHSSHFEDEATVKLLDGKVLSVDGVSELYDQNTGLWEQTGPLNVTRTQFTATLLTDAAHNGWVMVAGGSPGSGVAQCELYNPATKTFTTTGAGTLNVARYDNKATRLPSGKVLTAGGCCSEPPTANSAEVWDPTTGNWTLTNNLTISRTGHTLTTLADGRAFIIGGSYSASTEFYNPGTNSWAAGPDMPQVHDRHTSTLLADNRLLVAAGFGLGGAAGILTAAELFNPSGDTWAGTASMTQERYFHHAALLDNGEVLIAGGFIDTAPFALASSELFHASYANGQPCQVAADCATGFCAGGICCNSACGGTANSCQGGTCAACAANTANCDLRSANGCEANLTAIPNCGACGVTCNDGVACTRDFCAANVCHNVDRRTCANTDLIASGVAACNMLATVPGCTPTDTDGDGFDDAWEDAGAIDLNCDGVIDGSDVTLPGANKNRPDVYVHYDWMSADVSQGDIDLGNSTPLDHSPPDAVTCNGVVLPGAIDRVIQAFNDQGITLHVERGAALPHKKVIGFKVKHVTDASGSKNTCGVGETCCSGVDADAENFYSEAKTLPANKALIYKYIVFGHYNTCDSVDDCAACPPSPVTGVPPDVGATGVSEVPGNDFIVSIDSGNHPEAFRTHCPISALSDPRNPTLCQAEKRIQIYAGTMMHELGHTFGLRHGGADDVNYKPNYLSVMNYKFQFNGIAQASAPGGVSRAALTFNRFDYSRTALPDLVETNLNETNGVGSGTSDLTSYYCPGGAFIPFINSNGGIDWNCNTTPDETGISVDINLDIPLAVTYETDTGYRDWPQGGQPAHMDFAFQCTTAFLPGAPPDQFLTVGNELGIAEARAHHVLFDPIQVSIDVRPGCGSNFIAPSSSNLVPVAVLGSSDFDVTQIDASSLRFATAPPVGAAVIGDVNGDGVADLTSRYSMSSMAVTASSTTALITGALQSSQAIYGSDAITIVPYPGPVVTLTDDGTGNSVTMTNSLNHQMLTYSLTDCVQSVVDRCGNTLSISSVGNIVRVTSDEPDGGDHGKSAHGGGSDVNILSNLTFEVRRERTGTGDGRVYTVVFDVSDAGGNVTESQCHIQVLHDAPGPNAIDSGVHTCTGTGCP